jgi:Animal haem peroxidase
MRYETWADFGRNLRGTPEQQAELLALFKAAYGEADIHVNDVDLFVGGLAEKPFGASQMGSTFTWIFLEQLDRLQEGDRFYYFNQFVESPLFLADFGTQHFSDIIMRNTGLDHLHYDTFKVSEQIDLGRNERNHDFSALGVSAERDITFPSLSESTVSNMRESCSPAFRASCIRACIARH